MDDVLTIPKERRRQTMTLLSIEHLSKAYAVHRAGRRARACDDVNLSVRQGETVDIKGRSAGSAAAVLRCIWGTDSPDDGRILYDSERFGPMDLRAADQRKMRYLRTHELGYVSLFPYVPSSWTAYDAVLKSALRAFGASERERAEQEAEQVLRRFGVSERLWKTHPSKFSARDRLRLGFAIAMARRPRLLLVDGSAEALDDTLREDVRRLAGRVGEQGVAMLCAVREPTPSEDPFPMFSVLKRKGEGF